jgi:hypothetical protein
MSIILVIRHAEKPDGTHAGIDKNGAPDDESLIVRGWQRAGALPGLFGPSATLPKPDQIYASAAGKHMTADGKIGSKSKRPKETVSVLAAKLQMPIDDSFTKGQETALVGKITTLGGTTLVCWQHEAIPAIATAILGSSQGVPNPWPDDRFDVVWRFTQAATGGAWTFDQVGELLLPGDSAQPIA